MSVCAPPGRVYAFDSGKGRTRPLSDFLEFARTRYALVERREAQWLRCNPADLERFAPLWPGCVFPEDAQLRGTVRLGRGE
jgi:hypothetical protein